MVDPKRIVAEGYDTIAERYLAWSDLRPSATRLRYLGARARADPAGQPGPRARLRRRNPDDRGAGRRPVGDRCRHLRDPARDGAAECAGRHVHPGRHDDARLRAGGPSMPSWRSTRWSTSRATSRRSCSSVIRGWLRPGGLFLASMGADDEPGDVEADWLGVDMYFSHFGAKANRRLVEQPGSSSIGRRWRSSPRTATMRASSGSSPGHPPRPDDAPLCRCAGPRRCRRPRRDGHRRCRAAPRLRSSRLRSSSEPRSSVRPRLSRWC